MLWIFFLLSQTFLMDTELKSTGGVVVCGRPLLVRSYGTHPQPAHRAGTPSSILYMYMYICVIDSYKINVHTYIFVYHHALLGRK